MEEKEQVIETEHGKRLKIVARIMPKDQANEWFRQNGMPEVK